MTPTEAPCIWCKNLLKHEQLRLCTSDAAGGNVCQGSEQQTKRSGCGCGCCSITSVLLAIIFGAFMYWMYTSGGAIMPWIWGAVAGRYFAGNATSPPDSNHSGGGGGNDCIRWGPTESCLVPHNNCIVDPTPECKERKPKKDQGSDSSVPTKKCFNPNYPTGCPEENSGWAANIVNLFGLHGTTPDAPVAPVTSNPLPVNEENRELAKQLAESQAEIERLQGVISENEKKQQLAINSMLDVIVSLANRYEALKDFFSHHCGNVNATSDAYQEQIKIMAYDRTQGYVTWDESRKLVTTEQKLKDSIEVCVPFLENHAEVSNVLQQLWNNSANMTLLAIAQGDETFNETYHNLNIIVKEVDGKVELVDETIDDARKFQAQPETQKTQKMAENAGTNWLKHAGIQLGPLVIMQLTAPVTQIVSGISTSISEAAREFVESEKKLPGFSNPFASENEGSVDAWKTVLDVAATAATTNNDETWRQVEETANSGQEVG